MAPGRTAGVRRKPLYRRAQLEQRAKLVNLTERQLGAVREWARLLDSDKLHGERQNYLKFQQYIMEDLLGYDNIWHEHENIDFTVPGDEDGCHLLVVECKGTESGLDDKQYRKNGVHDTPMAQMCDYMMRHGEWGIVTNYRLFRLVKRSRGSGHVHEVDFKTLYDEDGLDMPRIAEFAYTFGELVRSGDDGMDADVDAEDREITGRFYRLFSDTRSMLAKEFGSCGADRLDAVRKAQTFLNRLIFLFFVEDRDMVKGGLFMRKLRSSLDQGFPDGNTYSVCRGIRDDLFRVLDGGYGKSIPKFNGGLFREDDITDMSFPDYRSQEWFADAVPHPAQVSSHRAKRLAKEYPRVSPAILNLVEMRQYSFQSDVDVNILGHVFEQSVQDIDGMESGAVRKSDGMYYTPQYIVDWICRQTILPYMSLSGEARQPEDLVREYAEQNRLPELEKRLREVRVLDPACGSGAFITGAAAVLLELHQAVHDVHVMSRGYMSASGQARLDEWSADATMRRIITRNIYGIDKNPQAVRIAQLSLFLLVASPNEPLPDTSRHIISGNSIICDGAVAPDAVDWAEAFPDVFPGPDSKDAGFDIIVGNPPYGAKLAEAERVHLKESFDIGGTNTAAIFVHQSLRLLKPGGTHGFIVPKSLMFSSREWTKTREALVGDLVSLVDVGKVWREVKLEQCIYVVRKGSGTTHYTAGVRVGDGINAVTCVDKESILPFSTFPSVASSAELNLGRKIAESSDRLGRYVSNRRGASIKVHKANDGVPVVGGKQVQPYYIYGVKFRVDDSNIDYSRAGVTDTSILVQRLVAHITRPIDHIRITATIPTSTDFVIDETVNHLITRESAPPHFVLGLLHSSVINWYVYRFVFSKGIRSIQFDPPTTNKIPIKIAREAEAEKLVKAMLECGGTGPEAERLFGELDRLFYEIFGLTPDEIRLVEESFPARRHPWTDS